MVSDWSGAALECSHSGWNARSSFSTSTARSTNADYTSLGIEPFEASVREQIGVVVDPAEPRRFRPRGDGADTGTRGLGAPGCGVCVTPTSSTSERAAWWRRTTSLPPRPRSRRPRGCSAERSRVVRAPRRDPTRRDPTRGGCDRRAAAGRRLARGRAAGLHRRRASAARRDLSPDRRAASTVGHLPRRLETRRRRDRGHRRDLRRVVAVLLANAGPTGVAGSGAVDADADGGWGLKCANSALKALELMDEVPAAPELRAWASRCSTTALDRRRRAEER